MLGMYDYESDSSTGWRNQMVKQSEPVFIAIFTLECVIKILAMGFIMSEGCYL